MKKIEVLVEIEYYNADRLYIIISLLKLAGLEHNERFIAVPIQNETTVLIRGLISENKTANLETIKDVVRVNKIN